MARAAKVSNPAPANGSPDVGSVAPSTEPAVFAAFQTEMAEPERIQLPPEVTTGNVARVMMDDEPLGFEEMAHKHAAPQPVPPPAPALTPEPIAPVSNADGVSFTLLERTRIEQEAGRAAIQRRASEYQRNQAITARENAKRAQAD